VLPTLYIDDAAAERQTERVRQLRKTATTRRASRPSTTDRTAEGRGQSRMVPLISPRAAYATVGEMCEPRSARCGGSTWRRYYLGARR